MSTVVNILTKIKIGLSHHSKVSSLLRLARRLVLVFALIFLGGGNFYILQLILFGWVILFTMILFFNDAMKPYLFKVLFPKN